MNEILPGIYRHFKGGTYIVYGLAEDATNPPPGAEPRPPQVCYRQDYGERKLLYRSVEDFTEIIDRPDRNYRGPRFVFIRPM